LWKILGEKFFKISTNLFVYIFILIKYVKIKSAGNLKIPKPHLVEQKTKISPQGKSSKMLKQI
jgi:hypothetical protein